MSNFSQPKEELEAAIEGIQREWELKQPRCETCRHWYWWGDDKPPAGWPWKMCNHPAVSGAGQNPRLMRSGDGCKKWTERKQ